MIRRTYSYVIAAAVWGIPGINIAIRGVRAYMLMKSDDLWWLMLITVAVSVFFFIIFRRVVKKYSERIASLPDKVAIWQIFPTRGWMLLVFFALTFVSLRLAISALSVTAVGVTLGDDTFPFRTLKSDMIVFLAMRLSLGHHNHKGYRNNRNQDTCDDVGGESLAEYQCADKNSCDRFEDSQN